MIKLTEEEKDTMSYADVAYLILKDADKKIKIQELFKKVIKAMDLPDSEFENSIGDFFEIVITDKRFIMLDNGYCDLKINHSTKIVIDDDDEEYEVSPDDDNIDVDDDDSTTEDSYDDEAAPDDDADDDLQDLVIIDENEDPDSEML
jgi:DNA-directed RNA polymerase delta subunit